MSHFPPIGPHVAVKCFIMDLMAECRYLTRRPESWQSAVVLLRRFSSWAPPERIRSAGLSLLPPPSVPHSDVLPRSPSLVFARLFVLTPFLQRFRGNIFCCRRIFVVMQYRLVSIAHAYAWLLPRFQHLWASRIYIYVHLRPSFGSAERPLSLWSSSHCCLSEFKCSSVYTFDQEIPQRFSNSM